MHYSLGTLGLSAVAIVLYLLQPKQYQKQLILSVIPNYNTETQQINITVRSPDTRFIA